jgi:hypothetical protein
MKNSACWVSGWNTFEKVYVDWVDTGRRRDVDGDGSVICTAVSDNAERYGIEVGSSSDPWGLIRRKAYIVHDCEHSEMFSG